MGIALLFAFIKSLVILLGFVLPLAGLLTLADRRYSSYIQDRIGPTRAHLFKIGGKPIVFWGIFHLVSDGIKFILKEWLTPAKASKGLFFWAPVINLGLALAIFFPIPFGPPVQFSNFTLPLQVTVGETGFIILLGIAGLSVYGILIGAWASRNKLGILGGMRASAMMLSYEIALTLSLVGILMVLGTTDLLEAVAVQNERFMGIPKWGLFVQPFGAILFFWAAFAETKRAPFDLPEAENEIIGFFVEYSSMGFGAFIFAEYVEVVSLAAIFSTLFLGGFELPYILEETMLFNTYNIGSIGAGLVGLAGFAIKVLFMCWVQLHIRWTLPRTRYDLLMNWGWKIMIPATMINIIFTGIILVLDPTSNLLIMIGLTIWLLITLVLFAGIRSGGKKEPVIIEV